MEQRAAAPPPLLVYQCHGCRAILGNNSTLVCSDSELQLIALRAASCVEVSAEESHVSEEGKDRSCSFSLMRCHGCQAPVGRVYRTTPRQLNSLQQQFSFHVAALSSYDPARDDVAAPGWPEPLARLVQLEERVSRIEDESLKVQKVLITQFEKILEHSDRLEEIGYLFSAGGSPPPPGARNGCRPGAPPAIAALPAPSPQLGGAPPGGRVVSSGAGPAASPRQQAGGGAAHDEGAPRGTSPGPAPCGSGEAGGEERALGGGAGSSPRDAAPGGSARAGEGRRTGVQLAARGSELGIGVDRSPIEEVRRGSIERPDVVELRPNGGGGLVLKRRRIGPSPLAGMGAKARPKS